MPTPQQPTFTRPALAPGLLGAIALVAGTVLIDSTIFIGFRYVIAILALIVLVFAYRGRGWIYLPFLAAIAVLWNPVVIVPLTGQLWEGMQFAAAVVFIVTAVRVKVPAEPETTSRGSVTPRRR
ncbi:DUF6804 family protein [Frondihabitans cladoniiphilus]|uniref:Integral membrane protein n=1 Tax=Frondihabitans cladoniiphilus TaxID=715785 RepID=A0ABP8VLG6_9MICO